MLVLIKALTRRLTIRTCRRSITHSIQRNSFETRQSSSNSTSRLINSMDSNGLNSKVVVELRSDTFTKPNKEMMQAIMDANVGDASYDEDPTTRELEERSARLFGKEAAIFTPSGSMSNLIAVMTHCDERSAEVILGDKSHIHIWEQGGVSQLGGVYSKQIETLPDGSFDLEKLESMIARDYSDRWTPITQLVCIENTHNLNGGRVLSLEFLDRLGALCKKHGLKLHLDGSRIMNAAIAMNVDVKELVKHCDTVNFCFSKGVGAPFGSVLVGTKAFIQKATRIRQVLGGGLRQSGLMAAACLVGLDQMKEHIANDNENAKRLAKHLSISGSGIIEVALTETNIIKFKVLPANLTSHVLVDRLKEVPEKELETLKHSVEVRTSPLDSKNVRMVTHRDVSSAHIDLAIQKFAYIFKELNA